MNKKQMKKVKQGADRKSIKRTPALAKALVDILMHKLLGASRKRPSGKAGERRLALLERLLITEVDLDSQDRRALEEEIAWVKAQQAQPVVKVHDDLKDLYPLLLAAALSGRAVEFHTSAFRDTDGQCRLRTVEMPVEKVQP